MRCCDEVHTIYVLCSGNLNLCVDLLSFLEQNCLKFVMTFCIIRTNTVMDFFYLAGEKKCLNSELWHACAGPLVSLPPVGSRVVYFPQGHSEQVIMSVNTGLILFIWHLLFRNSLPIVDSA